MLKFKINGAKELERNLKRLPLTLERRVAKSAVRAGAAVIAKEAKQRAPVDTGVLKRSIKVVARSRRFGDAVASVVTRAGKRWQSKNMDAWYAGLVEFGTRQRPATPFLRPAVDATQKQAVRAMAKKARERIAKLALG